MPSSHLILCCPLLLSPSIFPSNRVFSSESVLHIRWPKYWSFNFSIIPSNLGFTSFRIDWFDLLAVQGILKSLLQHHNLKASVLSTQPMLWSNSHIHDYWKKNIALTMRTLVSKVMSHTLSRFVVAFLPRNKHLLISWLQSPLAGVWEPK